MNGVRPPASLDEAFSLKGHRALITGGSGGLGMGIAGCMRMAGAEIVIAGTNADKLDAACSALGGTVSAVLHDVTDTANAAAFAQAVEAEHGPVSLLVNNAGNTVKKPLQDMSVEDFESVMDTHVTGAFALSRAFLPQLAASGSGGILFTASMSSFLGVPQVTGYSAAKAAYVGLVRSLASELAECGIRVNGVAPGWIETDLFRKATRTDRKRLEKIMGRIPMNRTGDPQDIGWAMVYLASPAAKYVTGHILVVDGGALHAF